jgi:hypothetical protein
MALNTQYAEEIHREYGYFAAWLPTANIQVGDVGIIKDGVFEKQGTLQDFGITFSFNTDPQTGDMDYASADAVAVEFKGGGNVPAAGTPAGAVDASASVSVGFKRADAVLFQASNCKTLTLSNLAQVNDTILSKYAAGHWPKTRVVVTEVVTCGGLTVLISSGANAHIDLSAKGVLSAGKANLASADAKLTVDKSSSISTRVLGATGSTPLFRANGIKTSFWGDPTVERRDVAKAALAPLEYNDFVGPSTERDG